MSAARNSDCKEERWRRGRPPDLHRDAGGDRADALVERASALYGQSLAELLSQHGEVRLPVTARWLPAGAGGLAAIHFIILLLVTGRLGAEAEARGAGPG